MRITSARSSNTFIFTERDMPGHLKVASEDASLIPQSQTNSQQLDVGRRNTYRAGKQGKFKGHYGRKVPSEALGIRKMDVY